MNIRTKDILGCLPLLASVLGNKYGIVVEIGGQIACTDGNTVHIPALPDNDADLLELVKGYIDHEAAHIRHTNFQAMRDFAMTRLEKSIFNMIEDWRVERELCRIFPGCRKNLNRLIHIFIAEEREGAGANPALSVMNYILLTIRAWDVAEVEPVRIREMRMLTRNYPCLLAGLDKNLDNVRRACPDTEAAIAHAKKIAVYLKGWAQTEGNSTRQEKSSEGKNEDQPEAYGPEMEQKVTCESETRTDGVSCNSRDESMAEKTDRREEREQELASSESGTEACDPNGQEKIVSRPDDQNKHDTLANALGSVEVKSLGEMIGQELSSRTKATEEPCIVVATETDKAIRPLVPEEKAEALRNSNALRRRLRGLLQAQILAPRSLGRSGVLEPRAIYRIGIGNPRAFARKSSVLSYETAIHVLLDRSCSMEGDRIRITRQAGYALAIALWGMKGMSLGVSAFPGSLLENGGNTILPIVRHGERPGDNFGIEICGATPLASALWRVIQILYGQPEKRKIILIITDGVPDNMQEAQKAIAKARGLGMEIYALGICTGIVTELVGKCGRPVWNLDELPATLFELLRSTLIKEG